ncbi:RNA polymerase II-associated factor 1 homolog [Ctenocephalides felis]|uniref:RNA polymerase II-associated factor 1 homolog n=1 Tax=Ctenocephalides felis TaxID=7515 RepID=UPI000E6E1270|nr:RNA polymerase II-associated factor 1 homolog [Ctenocephalides felis]XP_026473162.1 RNA polymerase II-associated factor 1 homolog [Ctenocephalides felis]
MAPTVQPEAGAEKRNCAGERRSDLACRVKYCNTLPDIPFDLKFITYPFEQTRFINYNPTSLERNYRYDVLTEHDLGVTIDLINKDTYQIVPYAQLDPADEKLLEEDILTPQDSQRSKFHKKSVSWLRRSEYISTEQTRFQPQSMEKVEAKVGYNVKKNFREETLYMDHASQIKAIEKTFADSKLPVEKHYSKPSVVPVEILPVYPDHKSWKYPCAQVIFDSDPAPVGKQVPAQIEEMSQAMIRGVMDESGEQFVAYFLPMEKTLEKRLNDIANNVLYTDDVEYEYKMAREYNWNVKSKASKGYEENYFLVVRQDGVYYNELETRVRLTKRRQKAGSQPNNTRLVVKHRPLESKEHRVQRYRERQLEPPREDDEEDEEEDDDELDANNENEDQQSQESITKQGENDEDEMNADQNHKTQNGVQDDESPGSNRSHSRSRSKSNSRAGSGSRSRSRSGSRNRSRSGSRSRSRSRSRSGSRSKSKSRSRSKSGSRSKSPSRSRSRSKSRSRSRSRSKSRSKSRSRSKSPSKSKSRSRSKSKSPSRSKSRSRSRSQSRSRSRSRSSSKSGARSGRSRSKSSNASSRSGSRSKSRSKSKSSSRSRSRSRSASAQRRSSAASSRSGSESEKSHSDSDSKSDSGSD